MLSLFTRILHWFEPSLHNELEQYIQTRNPQTAGELDHIIQEFSYKKQRGCI